MASRTDLGIWKAAHTPGPWTANGNEDGCIVAANGACVVCLGHDRDDVGFIDNESDARLISAAPDAYQLLAAIRADSSAYTWHLAIDHWLAKAEGR